MNEYNPGDLVWWQPAKATRPRRARVVRAEGRGYVVQVVDASGAPDPLWFLKDAEAGDLRPVKREAA